MTWLFYVMGMMVSHDLRSPPVLKWHFLSSVTSNAATAVSPEKNINFTLVMGLDGTPLVMQLGLYSRGIWYLLLWASSETSQWLQGGKSNSYFDSKWLKEIFYREIFLDLCFLKATSQHQKCSTQDLCLQEEWHHAECILYLFAGWVAKNSMQTCHRHI